MDQVAGISKGDLELWRIKNKDNFKTETTDNNHQLHKGTLIHGNKTYHVIVLNDSSTDAKKSSPPTYAKESSQHTYVAVATRTDDMKATLEFFPFEGDMFKNENYPLLRTLCDQKNTPNFSNDEETEFYDLQLLNVDLSLKDNRLEKMPIEFFPECADRDALFLSKHEDAKAWATEIRRIDFYQQSRQKKGPCKVTYQGLTYTVTPRFTPFWDGNEFNIHFELSANENTNRPNSGFIMRAKEGKSPYSCEIGPSYETPKEQDKSAEDLKTGLAILKQISNAPKSTKALTPPQKTQPGFPLKWVSLVLVIIAGLGLYYRQSLMSYFRGSPSSKV